MRTVTINIKSILLDLLNRAWIIILAFLIGLLGNYFLFERRKVPTYTSSATLFISTVMDARLPDGSVDPSNITNYYYSITISNASQLINLLQIVLPKDVCTHIIMEELDAVDGVADGKFTGNAGRVYSPYEIGAMTTIAQVKESVVMSVSSTTANAQDSVAIVNAVCNSMQRILNEVVGRGQVTPLQLAASASVTNLPSYRQPLIYGLLAALIVCAVIVFINIYDTRIHSKDEIVNIYRLTVLGEIPHFLANSDH